MKKITEETLNAIQENVRTRETQELDYRRENLFKGSWKDFKIKDLKPNLIPDGWDSFAPYGSGKNYVENWDFSNGKESWTNYNSTFEVIGNTLKVYNQTHSFGYVTQTLTLAENEYMIRVKRNELSNVTGVMRIESPQTDTKGIVLDENVTDYEISLSGKVYLYLYPQNKLGEIVDGGELWVDWVQITAINDQHLVVEKTPLGNGLTRIQTWGGNNPRKLRLMQDRLDKKMDLVFSMFLKDNNSAITITHDTDDVANINEGYRGYHNHSYQTKVIGDRIYNLVDIRAVSSENNLDFIASDPIINEGDKPNPTMIVTDLDDGREHVQVYGATKDTRLVYSGNEGFIGEDYGLKTTIENNGIDLDFSTSLTEEKKRIEKGENKVNLQGELSAKLSIEIGVPSE